MSTDWTFGGLWPYEPRWFDTADGRMHYVDEGPRDGRPVVLLHGNPTWGFLYRDFIGPLASAGHRVIVPDHLGFGRSDKPSRRESYRIAEHVRRMDALLESLDLCRTTIVPHDWGGPIGLAWAVAHPDRVRGLFILNTAAHVPRERFKVPAALHLFRLPGIGAVMVKGLNMFHRAFLFRAGVVDHSRLTPAVRRAYLAPHPTWSSRTGVLAFPRAIPITPAEQPWAAFAGELEADLKRHFRDRPIRIVWAMRDPSFGPEVLQSMWLDTFPDAGVLRLENAGHYLQEDAHEQIIGELLEFLKMDA
ncbi:alpha/beta fold hydrolase [Actinoallomurus iriomotensis]|uniref:Haloalkane dehalogenase n=1 Tax=Actinoallomurus iriomotensis TaxID=478107 RepID=A0A9W6VQ36_9ACTN|nr:alpha/beta fold hydrolase [Actinoallomurus iriomotensis]GLY75474.1 haloalkane dehalogenase [Actinoallomurus iriomotensis]